MKTLKVGQRVKFLHAFTGCRTGVITNVVISYIVKQDDGMAFRNDADNVIPITDKE